MHLFFALGRILLVAIFIFSGGTKLLDIAATAQEITRKVPTQWLADFASPIVDATGMPLANLLAILTGVVELVCGVLIAFNVGTRGAALVLVLFTIASTYYFHDFWTMTGGEATNNMMHTLKNVAIIGGLLVLFALGSWRPAVRSRID